MRLTIITIILLLITGSCEEKIFTANVNCDECYSDKPDDANLIIDFTINDRYFQKVPFVLYEGDIENNKVISIDTATYSPFEIQVPVNKKYAVKAVYEKNGVTLIAIDGTKLKLKLVTDACSEECYVIEDDKLDVRIKKDFLDF